MDATKVLAAMNEEIYKIDSAKALREYNAAYERWVHAPDSEEKKANEELCKARAHFMSF